jgi:translation initiation factor 1 (eIF-1/SUI1)
VLATTGLSAESLGSLLRELKVLCATGGTVKGAEAELQGDHRGKVRALLGARGILVKG